jgi:hypothetical protein
MPAKRPLEERFWEKVDKCGPTGPYVDTPCWTWTAARNRRGYGQIGVRASRPAAAHRVSWELANGPISDSSLGVLHRCNNTSCVNPDHLYLGTPQQNADDRIKAARNIAPKGQEHANALLSDDAVIQILDLRLQGLTYAEIGRRFGITATSANDVCANRSWRHVDRTGREPELLLQGVRRGSSHPRFRITKEVREQMQAMRAAGETYSHIAAAFKVSAGAAWKACNKSS